MMKDKHKRVIILVLVITAILLYGHYMNAENRRLYRDLNRLNCRIKRLEIDKTMQKIIDLREQNSLMQEKIVKLQDGLIKLRLEKTACQNQLDMISLKGKAQKSGLKEKPKVQNTPSSPAKGNRGYLLSK
ncbi:MAG: hypothetical protein NTU54_06760 [Candidatus Omnitrophica bacterium]|nr:hypothetical protein [Candidatus Omnitrophota bacterium]